MAWISFRFLNLAEGVTGGLLENVDDAIGALTGLLGDWGPILEILAGAFIGLALIFLFPIHWAIFYRPDDIGLIIAVTIPWILCCVITSGLFAHSPRGGIHTSLAIGIGYAIILSIVYLVLIFVLPFGAAIIDGIFIGLTDLPYLAAVLTAVLEGCLVGTVFGGFIGSLKYKPKGGKSKKVKSKEVEESTELSDTNIAITRSLSSKEVLCTNCGVKITAEDLFCTNCGAKKP
jgi:hypothetical protein